MTEKELWSVRVALPIKERLLALAKERSLQMNDLFQALLEGCNTPPPGDQRQCPGCDEREATIRGLVARVNGLKEELYSREELKREREEQFEEVDLGNGEFVRVKKG